MFIIDAIIDLLLILLICRYFIQGFGYYSVGPLLQLFVQITEPICQPFRRFLSKKFERDYAPLVACLALILVRGLLFFLILNIPPIRTIKPTMPFALFYSLKKSILLVIKLLIFVTFIGYMAIVAGISSYGNVAVRLLIEAARKIMNCAHFVIRTENLKRLCIFSIILLILVYVLFNCLLTINISLVYAIYSFMEILRSCIIFYIMLIFFNAILSWFSPDPYNSGVILLRVSVEPCLRLCRRLFPWARIAMIDLSPMLATFGLIIILNLSNWLFEVLLNLTVKKY